jgi:hypothetical protein
MITSAMSSHDSLGAVHGDRHTKIDLDRPAGFVAVFKSAESDLPR